MDDYAELKSRYETLRRKRDLAQAKNEQAEEQLKKLIAEVKERYEVDSLDEGKEMLAQLIEERDALALKIAQELDKVNG